MAISSHWQISHFGDTFHYKPNNTSTKNHSFLAPKIEVNQTNNLYCQAEILMPGEGRRTENSTQTPRVLILITLMYEYARYYGNGYQYRLLH